MINLAPIDAELADAERELAEALASCVAIESEIQTLTARLAALRVKPAATEFADARAWREARDAQLFERTAVAGKLRELEASHAPAAGKLVAAEGKAAAAAGKATLAHAADALASADRSTGQGSVEWAEFQRAHATYFQLPGEIRGNDFEFVAACSRISVMAIFGGEPAAADAAQ